MSSICFAFAQCELQEIAGVLGFSSCPVTDLHATPPNLSNKLTFSYVGKKLYLSYCTFTQWRLRTCNRLLFLPCPLHSKKSRNFVFQLVTDYWLCQIHPVSSTASVNFANVLLASSIASAMVLSKNPTFYRQLRWISMLGNLSSHSPARQTLRKHAY